MQSQLPRSDASKVYHSYVEAMKGKPKSFFSANQRYPQSPIQLTLHHIIPKSNMEFLWMIGKLVPEIDNELKLLSWQKLVHEISVEGLTIFHSLIEDNSYMKNLWETGVYSIQDSIGDVFVIIPFAVQKLKGVVNYHEAAFEQVRLQEEQRLQLENERKRATGHHHHHDETNSVKTLSLQLPETTSSNHTTHDDTPIAPTMKTFISVQEVALIKELLSSHISLTPTIRDNVNREGSLVVNSIVWAAWNLFIGPSERPIGTRPGFDAKEAFVMESTKPLSFPTALWGCLRELNELLTESWKSCLGRIVTTNNGGKSMSQARVSSSNTVELTAKFVKCLKSLRKTYQ
jgi:hypothetical protein